MKRALLALLTLVLLSVGGISLAQNKTPEKVSPPVTTTKVEPIVKKVKAPDPRPNAEELLVLTNKERVKAGVKPLAGDPLLNKSAQLKSDDQNNNKYFGHVNPTTGKHGYEYIAETGTKCVYNSENLTQNIYKDNSERAVAAWMRSTAHRKALLDPRYEYVGFGESGGYVTAHYCDAF